MNQNNTTEDFTQQFDYFICGSDQIWNPSYKTTSALAFCSFAPEKTVCLSPSFGVSKIPDHRKEEYAKLLKDIYKLSTREEKGSEIIKELTNREAPVLLDPTMILPTEKWHDLCKKTKIELPEKYIACYFLGKIDKEYRRRIKKFAKENNLPIVMLFDITTPQYYTLDPAEVLHIIKNSQYVLTDSFHGSVFSILFHKNFCVFARNEGGSSMNSRLETLLLKFGIKNTLDISQEEWGSVDNVIISEREKTKKYLEEAFLSVGEKSKTTISNAYAGYLKDNEKIIKSASGGASAALGEAVINNGGVVFGVTYSKDFKSAQYTCCDNISDLDKIKGSKYVDKKMVFSEVSKQLKEEKTVLFFGLGCDVGALVKYCEKSEISTDNLYTVDILCHGPMSQIVHQKYIEDLEKKYKSKVIYFTSRSKKDGWSSSSFIKVVLENGKVLEMPFDDTDYGYVFKNYALEKCENCHFKGELHRGDLCIGDFWGVTDQNAVYNKNGVSLIIVQTQKGENMLDLIKDSFTLEKTDFTFALEHNPMYFKSRKSKGDYKKLIQALKEDTLHNTLKKIPEYKVSKQTKRKIKIKRILKKLLKI